MAGRDFSLLFRIGGNISRSFRQSINDVRSNLDSIESKSKAAGKAMMAFSAVAMAGIGASVKTAIDFEAAMSKVGAISRANKEDLIRLTATARELGATTAWSASQAAEGMQFLAMAGFSVNDTIAAMPGMLALASAGAVDLADAADIASNILTGFGLKSKDMGRVADVMTNAFTQSNVSVQMLGETMKYVAPVAESLGVSIETTAAMTGKLGDAGIQASMAGTALRAIMSRLAAPPKAAADALKSLNVQTKDAKGNLRDLPTILAEIEKKTAKMGNAKKAGLFKAIAGEEAFSAMSVLAKQAGTGELQKFTEKMKETGSAQRVAKQMLDNTKGAIVQLKSAIEGIMISVGNVFLPIITDATNRMTGVVNAIQTWSNANPELFAQLAKVAAVVALVIGGLGALSVGIWALSGPIMLAVGLFLKLWTVIKFLFGIVRIIFYFGRLLAIITPVGAAITALIAVGYLLYKNWETISPMLGKVWEGIKSIFSAAWEAIKSGVSSAWEAISGFFTSGITNISATIINWSPLGLFYQAFAGVLNWFGVDLPSKFTDFGKMIIQGLINGITNMASQAVEAAKAVASSVASSVKGFFGIHSPSRLFTQFGEYNMMGLANGMQNESAKTAAIAHSSVSKALPTGENRSEQNIPSINTQSLSNGLPSARNTSASLSLTQNITVSGSSTPEQAKELANQSFKQFESQFNAMMNKRQRVAY